MSWTWGPSDWIVKISSDGRLLTADFFLLPPRLTFFLGPQFRVPCKVTDWGFLGPLSVEGCPGRLPACGQLEDGMARW